jgi:hypothetical protein
VAINDNLQNYIALNATKKKLEDELEIVKANIKAEAEKIQNFYTETGCSSMKVDGMTIYVSRTIWAGKAEDTTALEVVKALLKLKLGHIANINHQSISGYVRGLAKEAGLVNKDGQITATCDQVHDLLVPTLKELIKVTDTIGLNIRKG